MIEPLRMNELKRHMIIRFGLAAVAIPVILYALAGTLHYWQGWLYWAVLVIPMLAAAGYFFRTDPEMLERRMRYREKEPEQRAVILLSSAVLAAGFLAVGYDLRLHGLNQLSPLIIFAADAGVFLGYCFILWVLKENSYASRTIEIVEGQRVISTGPYSIIRHPMYLGFLIMLLLTPPALGSWRAMPVFLLYIPVMVLRILNEEKVLLRDLPGYREYCLKRPYRLLPYIW